MTKVNQYWALIIILLVAIIIVGGIVIWSRYSPGKPIELSLPEPPPQEQLNQIYIGGAVNSPGFHPVKATDSINDIIQAAGGTTSNADLSRLRFYVPGVGEEEQPQKIDLNRAEGWLLEALPGIGKTRAQAIINYRRQNGPFRNIIELTKVEDIGTAIYEKIKDLITVAD